MKVFKPQRTSIPLSDFYLTGLMYFIARLNNSFLNS